MLTYPRPPSLFNNPYQISNQDRECRVIGYLAFIQKISTKLSLQREEIKTLQSSIGSLKADLAELQTQREVLITEKQVIDTKRFFLKDTIQDLEVEEKSVQRELGADVMTGTRSKAVDRNTRVWLRLKHGAVQDEIETAELERDDLLIDRELIQDKQEIVREGICVYQGDIARICARLAAIQKGMDLTGIRYRRCVKKFELIWDQGVSAC